MWEDNGLMLRVLYYAKRISRIESSFYHYERGNVNAMSQGYGISAVRQMISCATQLTEFFTSKPDGEKYRKTVYALQFLAKLNLVTSRFDWLREYHSIFPDCNCIINHIKPGTFSRNGYIRFLFVKYHMAWLFVLLFKFRNFINRGRNIAAR